MTDDDLPGPPSLTSLAVDTLPINLTVLDGEGTIVHTNRAWREFAEDNDIALRPDSLGVDYLAVTDAADDEHARRVADGPRGLLTGDEGDGDEDGDRDGGGDGDIDRPTEVLAETIERLLSTTEKGWRLHWFLSRTTTPGPRDLSALAGRSVTTTAARHPNASVDLEAPGEAVALGLAELDTALEELVDNAILHADRDEPTVAVSVEVHDEWVDLQVADDGPGIPPMEYESLDSERLSPLSHDTGFGLNLVYWIVVALAASSFSKSARPAVRSSRPACSA